MGPQEAILGYEDEKQRQVREAKLRDVVEGWELSGKTQKDYCEERELKVSTFRGWVKEYRSRQREKELSAVSAEVEAATENEKPIVQEGVVEPAMPSEIEARPGQAAADEVELVAVDVVTDKRKREDLGQTSLKGPRQQRRGIGLFSEKGLGEAIEIELPSGIVIRLCSGTEAWRVAGIVREIQNTC